MRTRRLRTPVRRADPESSADANDVGGFELPLPRMRRKDPAKSRKRQQGPASEEVPDVGGAD